MSVAFSLFLSSSFKSFNSAFLVLFSLNKVMLLSSILNLLFFNIDTEVLLGTSTDFSNSYFQFNNSSTCSYLSESLLVVNISRLFSSISSLLKVSNSPLFIMFISNKIFGSYL